MAQLKQIGQYKSSWVLNQDYPLTDDITLNMSDPGQYSFSIDFVGGRNNQYITIETDTGTEYPEINYTRGFKVRTNLSSVPLRFPDKDDINGVDCLNDVVSFFNPRVGIAFRFRLHNPSSSNVILELIKNI